jgi:hypothetical protein
VARDGELVAHAQPFSFNVVERLSKVDTTSWPYVSQNGTEQEVLEHLAAHNLNRLDLAEVAWRMKDKAFFGQTIDLLTGRRHYHHDLWSYGIYHDVLLVAREYLKHSPYADRVGAWVDTPLLTVDPVARHAYQHMEYEPLVNPRAHPVGKARTILNHRMREQYQRLMKVLSYKAALDDADALAVAYYLLLQDRVEEGLEWFASVKPDALPTRLQYDYMKAYVSLYEENLEQAASIAKAYAEYPVPRWRNRFVNLANQLKEVSGAGALVADAKDREQTQNQLAATEPALDLKVEARRIELAYQNLDACTLNVYPMDIELLFSRNPFIQQQSAQFSFIRPVMSQAVELPAGSNTVTRDLPKEFRSSNVMVEVVAGGLRKAQAYFANTLSVQMIENYGQVAVRQAETRKPLSRVYVKVYARMKDGSTMFFKDGYTDFRGRFDYVSLNTNELDGVDRFSLLILSDEHGAVIREAAPPKR